LGPPLQEQVNRKVRLSRESVPSIWDNGW